MTGVRIVFEPASFPSCAQAVIAPEVPTPPSGDKEGNAERKREMAIYVHSVMYDRLSPGAREGAYTKISADTLQSIFPDI